jgi:FAD/FMN-containing dehydrogenase
MPRIDCRHELQNLLNGTVVARGSPRYLFSVGQYAFTSHYEDMAPSFIIYPKDELDIKKILKYAAKEGYNVAVRTGGHQYSGASSTKGGDGL